MMAEISMCTMKQNSMHENLITANQRSCSTCIVSDRSRARTDFAICSIERWAMCAVQWSVFTVQRTFSRMFQLLVAISIRYICRMYFVCWFWQCLIKYRFAQYKQFRAIQFQITHLIYLHSLSELTRNTFTSFWYYSNDSLPRSLIKFIKKVFTPPESRGC